MLNRSLFLHANVNYFVTGALFCRHWRKKNTIRMPNTSCYVLEAAYGTNRKWAKISNSLSLGDISPRLINSYLFNSIESMTQVFPIELKNKLDDLRPESFNIFFGWREIVWFFFSNWKARLFSRLWMFLSYLMNRTIAKISYAVQYVQLLT